MSQYRAPLAEMHFVLTELAGLDQVATLPGYEEVGRRRILLGCWGSFNNPDVCDYTYKNMSNWGRGMYVTPGVVVDGELVTTDLVDINPSLNLNTPELQVKVDRQRAADIAVRMTDISDAVRLFYSGEDEITRFKLNDELIALWRAVGNTVVFVTHSVFESVYLSSRIVVMTPRPGRVFADLAIEAPFPRDEGFRTSPEYGRWCRTVSQALVEAMAQPAQGERP